MNINDFGGDDNFDDDIQETAAADRGDIVEDDTDDTGTEFDGNNGSDAGDDTDPGDSGSDGELDEADESEESEPEPDEGRDEDDESEDGDTDNDESNDKDNGTVPRARLNKESLKRKQAEARVKALEAQLQGRETQTPKAEPEAEEKPADIEIDMDKFKKMQIAMLDEDTEAAAGIFKELLSSAVPKQEKVSVDDIRAEIRAELLANQAQEKVNAKANEMFERYPELNHNSDDRDEDMIAEVIRLRDANRDGGMEPDEALADAVDYVAYRYDLEDRVKAKEKKAPPQRKKKVDVERKKELASKERGKLKGSSGAGEKTLDISKLSESEYDKLSEDVKRKARGDYL